MFDNPKAKATEDWLRWRLEDLEVFADDSPEYTLLKRIQPFPFSRFPDTTIPWHLLQWEHMDWEYTLLILQIIESFKHVKGSYAGKPLTLEPFQVLALICFLAPFDPKTGHRLVRTVLFTISRKNAKSSLTAAFLTAAMALRPEKGGYYRQDLYVGASDREQAGEIYDMCSGFITQDHTLGIANKFKCTPSGKTVQHLKTLTKLKVLSSDAYRAHGRNAICVVYDEIGNVPSTMAEEFYNVLTSGFGAQEEALAMLLSTQAANDAHIFSTMVDHCKKINQNGPDEEEMTDMAGFVYEVPDQIGSQKIDPFDEAYWYLGNPGLLTPDGLGRTLLKDLRKQAKEAKALPSLESKFRNRRLNQRANPYNPVISRSVWEANGGTFDRASLKGKRCWMGLDLSSVKDLTALVLVFEPVDGTRPVLPFFWLPSDGLNIRERQDKVPYHTWAKAGYLNTDAEKTIDYKLVVQTILECIDEFDVQGIGYDKWKIKDLQTAMRDAGLTELVENERWFIEIWQGPKFAELGIQALERALANEELAHASNPVLTWNAANAVSTGNAEGHRKLDKAKSYGRIDGIVALCMALRAEEVQAQTEEAPAAAASEGFAM